MRPRRVGKVAPMDDPDKAQSPAPGGPFGPGSPGYGPGGEPPKPETPAGPQSPAPAPPPPPGPETPAPPPQAPSYGGPVPPGGWDQPAVADKPPVPLQGALAGWGARFGATVIDGLILLVPTVLLVAFVVAVALSSDVGGVVVGIISFLVFLVVALLYAPVLMMRQGEHNGQTFGKQVVGIRVVRDSGQPFDFGSAALREIVLKGLALGIAGSVIPLIPYLVNYLWPLWDDQNRALHDMVVSTHVVRA